MLKYAFRTNDVYSRKDVYRVIGISEDTHGGVWDTGYAIHNEDYFIFTNVGVPGRTGHNYKNRFEGDRLIWFAKTVPKIGQPQIKELLSPPGYVYVFFRTENKAPFTYAGTAIPIAFEDVSPVQITWQIINEYTHTTIMTEEDTELHEGKALYRTGLIFERNPLARKRCIDHYGCRCYVCGFNFEYVYGEKGRGFIHVHHLVPLSNIGSDYIINPIEDLRPICPNCHAMIHRQSPALSIDELKHEMRNQYDSE